MKLKVVVCLLAFFSFTAAAAYAQETPQKLDVFVGYSYVRDHPSTSGLPSFNLHGGSASAAYNVNNWLGAVADFGGYHTNSVLGSGVDATLSTYLFGPRISYRRHARFTPFAQALFGVAHSGVSFSGTDNAFAASFGGGVDVRLSPRFSWRPAQVDYLLTRFPEVTTSRETQNNLRVSTGLVFHF